MYAHGARGAVDVCSRHHALPSHLDGPTTIGTSNQRRPLFKALVGGLLMYLYLALLYIAIGLIPTGVAMTLFFTFPVFTGLLAWVLLKQRPTLRRWG